MLTIYRIAYGLVLGVFLANVLKTIDFRTTPLHQSVLLTVAAVSLCGLLVPLLAFDRTRQAFVWPVVVVWELLFIWYAWFIPAAPFTQREAHSFDPTAAAQETMRHNVWAGALFAILFLWFLSLPILHRRRTAAHV
jgi:hypothetical protein